MKQNVEIILASNSPRRKELLGQMGLSFSVITSDCEESSDKEKVSEYVMELAGIKANAVAERVSKNMSNYLVVGADTVVALDEQVLGKPHSKEEALEMLMQLSGKRHWVYTGVCLVTEKGTEAFYSKTAVYMRPFTEREAIAYINTKEPMDKAGSYGIQGIGAFLVDHIEGDYNTVVGFPLSMFINYCLDKNYIEIGE